MQEPIYLWKTTKIKTNDKQQQNKKEKTTTNQQTTTKTQNCLGLNKQPCFTPREQLKNSEYSRLFLTHANTESYTLSATCMIYLDSLIFLFCFIFPILFLLVFFLSTCHSVCLFTDPNAFRKCTNTTWRFLFLIKYFWTTAYWVNKWRIVL